MHKKFLWTILPGMKTFKPYNPDQLYLVPPALRDWFPVGHLALFISDVVDTLVLEPILSVYEQGNGRGQPPYQIGLPCQAVMFCFLLPVQ